MRALRMHGRLCFATSRRWCFLTLRPGREPVSALVEAFLETWQLDRTSTQWPNRRNEWVDALVAGRLAVRDLLDQTEHRHAQLQGSKPPAFLLYVDQGEELYVRAKERQRWRFSELLAQALSEPRPRTMMSLRSDFLGSLHSDTPLFKARLQVDVPPLGEQELREVVSQPAAQLSASFESENLIDIITRRAAQDHQGRGGVAAPLLHARRYVDTDAAAGRWNAAPARGILRSCGRAGRSRQHFPQDTSGRRAGASACLDLAMRDGSRGRRADQATRRPRRVHRTGMEPSL